ncbi:MAG: hypothetical protein ACI8SE_000922 [Bacteroidia bacterium]
MSLFSCSTKTHQRTEEKKVQPINTEPKEDTVVEKQILDQVLPIRTARDYIFQRNVGYHRLRNLGVVSDSNDTRYCVFTDYAGLQLAITVRGIMHVMFANNVDTFYYRVDNSDQLPIATGTSGGTDCLIYMVGDSLAAVEFTCIMPLLCTASGCFEDNGGDKPPILENVDFPDLLENLSDP